MQTAHGGARCRSNACQGLQEQRNEPLEEEEERLPRSHGRWALASSPGGPAQTSQGSTPSYLRKSQTDLAAPLRTLFPAGCPGLSVGELQRHCPICLWVPVTNRLRVLDPLKSVSQNRSAGKAWVSPGHHPRLITPLDKDRSLDNNVLCRNGPGA